MRRFECQPCYLLRKIEYRETSYIGDFLTRDYGRVSAIVKGARRAKSPYRGLLQLFVPLMLSAVGRSELLTVTDLNPNGNMPLLKGERLTSAFYVNELVFRLMHKDDPHPVLFEGYALALNTLSNTDNLEGTLRRFEKIVLKDLGYALSLTQEAHTGFAIHPEASYGFDPVNGLVKVETTESSPSIHVHSVFVGKSLLALAEDNLTDKTVLMDAKRLMRLALAVHLGNKPLDSRRLW